MSSTDTYKDQEIKSLREQVDSLNKERLPKIKEEVIKNRFYIKPTLVTIRPENENWDVRAFNTQENQNPEESNSRYIYRRHINGKTKIMYSLFQRDYEQEHKSYNAVGGGYDHVMHDIKIISTEIGIFETEEEAAGAAKVLEKYEKSLEKAK